MNGLPYYKAYPRDFIEGTIGMRGELKGAYRVLLDLIYMQDGQLPDDPHYISGLLGYSVRKWKSLRQELIDAGKIEAENGIISQFRADKELEITRSYQDKQAENRRGPKKNKGLKKPPSNHTDTEPYTEDTSVSSYKRPKRKTRLPDDSEITEAMHRAASKRNHSPQEAEAQFEKFKNWHVSKGNTFVDWDRAFITWLDSPYFKKVTGGFNEQSTADFCADVAADWEREQQSKLAGRSGQGSVVPLLAAGRG